MIDGIIQPIWSSYPSYASAIEERLAMSTPYSINFDVQGNGTDYHATVSVAQISANNEHKVLHVSLTESHIPESWYGGDEINFVNRLMLPDQYGTPMATKVNFEFDFSLEPGWVADSMEIVAFIQDTITKEIFQARNFALKDATLIYYDVALQEIIHPNDEFCANEIAPIVKIKNHSYEILESCFISYNINGELHEYNWVGELEQDSSLSLTLPEVSFLLQAENILLVNVSLPNGKEDENQENNSLDMIFYEAQIIEEQELILELLSDDFGNETSWEIIDSQGNLLESGDDYDNNTLYTIPIVFEADDCYKFIIYDDGGNGICCENGEGYYKITNEDGLVFFEGGGYAEEDASTFQIDIPTSVTPQINDTEVKLFPNPASDFVYIQSDSRMNAITIYNSKGIAVLSKAIKSNYYQCSIQNLLPGLYFMKIESGMGSLIRRLLIQY
jgi:hypothetical protein